MRRNLSILIAACLLFFATTAFCASEKAQVQAAYYAWINTLSKAKGDPRNVMKLYAKNAVLLATLENKPLTTKQGFEKYFVRFTGLKDLSATTQQLITQVFPSFAINSGIYIFSYQDEHGKTQKVKARFSFVYRKVNGKWLIVNHHSSRAPNNVNG